MDFWWPNISVIFPRKIGLNYVAQDFTIFFTAGKDICHRELTLGASSPKIGALRKGPPFHGSRSYREINIQNEGCQMGGREVKKGDKTASFCKKMSGREVTRR